MESTASPLDDPNLVLAIGIDVGGTKIAGGVVAVASGQILARDRVPADTGRGGAAVLADVVAMAERLKSAAEARGGRIRGVGVGVCELVDPAGEVRTGFRIAWPGLPVQERLATIAPATIESDVRAAALAEARFGAGRPYAGFAYVTVGTGISCTLVLDGRPLFGARGAALVLASGPLSSVCPRCGHRHDEVVEDVASGPALAAAYARAAGRDVAGAEAVLSAAAAGDAAATAIVDRAAESLGNAVGFLVNVVDPAALVVGGGLGLAGGRYWDHLLATTRAHIWNTAARDLPILPAALGTDAGVIGAALAAGR